MLELSKMLETFKNRLETLSDRERLLSLVTLCVVVYLLADTLIYSPLYKHLSVKKSQLIEQQQTIQGIIQIQSQESNAFENQKLALTQEIEGLKAQLAEKRKDKHYGLSASDMLIVLDSVIRSSHELEFIEIENNPAEHITSNILYAHPVKLVFEGRFVDIYGFISSLEMLPVPVVFDLIEYEVVAFPKARVHLQMSFITQTKGFIEF